MDITFVNSLTGICPGKLEVEFTQAGITHVLEAQGLPTLAPDGSMPTEVFKGITSGLVVGQPSIRTLFGQAYDKFTGREHKKRRHQQLLKKAPDGLIGRFCGTSIPCAQATSLVDFAERCASQTSKGNARKAANLPPHSIVLRGQTTKS